MSGRRPVLRLRRLPRAEALQLLQDAGADATILDEDLGPSGGYGDLGTVVVAVTLSERGMRAAAKHLSGRQRSHDETVSVPVEIDDPDGTRRAETVTYRAEPGQSTVDAAVGAIRALPGVGPAPGW
jgi:hypothetical protein